MASLVEVFRPRTWPRAAALTLIAFGIGGCSGESLRFNDNPFAKVETAAAVPPAQPPAGARVETTALPAASAGGTGMAGGGRGMASYTPPRAPTPAAHITGS